MSVATEEQRIRNLFERVETIEEVASTLPEDDDRRTKLLAVSRDALAEEGAVRPVSHVLREIRADGLERDLLEHVWHRLADQALLDRADLRESIDQMRSGDVVVLRPLPDKDS